MHLRWLPLLLLLPACGGAVAGESLSQELTDTSPVDGIVFVHGISGDASDWETMVSRFKNDGWPEERLLAGSFTNPSWSSNTTNASQLEQWVQELQSRGATRIAVVAHSMGGLSSRHYLQRLGGTDSVAVFVTLGTMHHGLFSSCLSPLPVMVWKELCLWSPFVTGLNKEPATPGPTRWVSIFSTDDLIVGAESSRLEGAQNIELEGLGHEGPNGLQDSPVVYQHVKNAL